METPSSMRRFTRSQPSAASQKIKTSTERSALIDITNDSPIVGVAMTGVPDKTPGSKNAVWSKKDASGSGEALLRGQVRTLLQKVEEDGEMVSKITSGDRPGFRVLLDLPGPSPVQMAAPTPANTPQILGLSMPMDVAAEKEDCVKIVSPQAGPKEEEEEEQLNRALLFDSPEKSEASVDSAASAISSSLTFQDSETEKSLDEDSSSAWSLQVNASAQHDDEDGEEEADVDGDWFDELCEGLSKMSMNNNSEFAGTHTRFVYDDRDESIEREEVVGPAVGSPSAMVLKGMPVPEGKHLRFQDEEDDDE